MSFFNDVGRKTYQTTTKIAKETKLKLQVNENKCRISDIYEEIGKKVYEKYVREEDIDIKKELEEECGRIDEIAMDIKEARMEILGLNNKRQCRKCNMEISSYDVFCSQCGEKQKEEEKTVFEEAILKLADAEIKPENRKEAEHIKTKLRKQIEEQSE